MNTILVWILVTVGGYNSNQVVYSPPMPDQATCEFLQKNMPETPTPIRSKCVQIRMVLTK